MKMQVEQNTKTNTRTKTKKNTKNEPGCSSFAFADGLCSQHYKAKHGHLPGQGPRAQLQRSWTNSPAAPVVGRLVRQATIPDREGGSRFKVELTLRGASSGNLGGGLGNRGNLGPAAVVPQASGQRSTEGPAGEAATDTA